MYDRIQINHRFLLSLSANQKSKILANDTEGKRSALVRVRSFSCATDPLSVPGSRKKSADLRPQADAFAVCTSPVQI